MYYIGVDLGTSAVKLLMMDGSGKIMNIVSPASIRFLSRIRAGRSRSRKTGGSRARKALRN